MEKITKWIVVAIFLTLIIGVGGRKKRGIVVTTNDDPSRVCSIPFFAAYLPTCQTTDVTTIAPSTKGESTTEIITETTTSYFDLATDPTTDSPIESTSLPPTSLERAHWCLLPNNSFASLNSVFMYQSCFVCQCLATRKIRCTKLQCMPAYCIDNSIPVTRAGQCCSQCSYEIEPISCSYKGVPFPHGTLLKRTNDNLQCWCQYGIVECRKVLSSVSRFGFLSGGTSTYVFIIIIICLIFLGIVICTVGGLLYYYYYKRNQEVYEEYWNNGGWQPMGEEEQVVDAAALEKQMEAEQSQYQTEFVEEYIPPPYAFYNGSYPNEETVQHSK